MEQVVSGMTWVLRQRVLRPHQQVRDMALPGDDGPTSAHFAAYDVSGPADGPHEVVGVASVLAQPEPPRELAPADDVPAGWRVRGMATAPHARGQGVGRTLLVRVLDHVRRAGGQGVWANARMGALEFYLACGFLAISEPFELPEIGSHVRVRTLLR